MIQTQESFFSSYLVLKWRRRLTFALKKPVRFFSLLNKVLFFWPLTLISSEDTFPTGKYILILVRNWHGHYVTLQVIQAFVKLTRKANLSDWMWWTENENRPLCLVFQGSIGLPGVPGADGHKVRLPKTKRGYPSNRFDDCGKKYLWLN